MSTDLAEQVAEVAEQYRHSDRSTACLLEDAGFPELRDALNVDDVEDALKNHPELIDFWLERATDQRVAGGWSIECQGDAYRIQSYSSGEFLVVRDRVRACAEFIVRYSRFIGEVQARTMPS
jgi:hypothetical protein